MGRTWIVAQEHAEPTAAVSEAAPVAAGRAVRGEHATCVAWCESADAHAVLSVGYADGSIACFEVRSSALPGKPGKAGGAGDGLGSLVLNVTPTLSIDLEKAGVIKACAGTRAVVDVRWDGAGDCLAAVYCCGGCVLWSPGGGVMGYTLEAGSGDSEEEDEGYGVDAEARRAWTGDVGEIAGAGGGLAWSTDGYQLYVPAGGGACWCAWAVCSLVGLVDGRAGAGEALRCGNCAVRVWVVVFNEVSEMVVASSWP